MGFRLIQLDQALGYREMTGAQNHWAAFLKILGTVPVELANNNIMILILN